MTVGQYTVLQGARAARMPEDDYEYVLTGETEGEKVTKKELYELISKSNVSAVLQSGTSLVILRRYVPIRKMSVSESSQIRSRGPREVSR